MLLMRFVIVVLVDVLLLFCKIILIMFRLWGVLIGMDVENSRFDLFSVLVLILVILLVLRRLLVFVVLLRFGILREVWEMMEVIIGLVFVSLLRVMRLVGVLML